MKIMWPNVAKLVVNRPIPFSLKGAPRSSAPRSPANQGPHLTRCADGNHDGGSAGCGRGYEPTCGDLYRRPSSRLFTNHGNSHHLRNGSLLGELSARSESLRLTILGRYIYGDNTGNLIVRNSRGTIKLDFFLTKRLYWFASAYFEQDTFQDLKLRTALATGPGYQPSTAVT